MQNPLNRTQQKEKLARTMRIDIAPEMLDPEFDRKGKLPAKIITKRTRPAQQADHATGPSTATRSMASADPDFDELLHSIYDAAIITDMTGKIVNANARSTKFFGYTREQLMNATVMDLISGADQTIIDTIRQNLVARFVLIEACYCTRSDESFFPAEIAVNQLTLSHQDFLCFFIRDITLRRQAEEQLKMEHNAIENSGSGIVITNLDATIEYANPALAAMWQKSGPGELIGKNLRELLADGTIDQTFIKSIVDSDKTWVRELSARSGTGTPFEVQTTATANRDSDGELVGLVFSFVNISDRKRAEQAELQTERQRVMLESLGAACHHLGQPATVLLANLGIMRRKVEDPTCNLKELIHNALDAAESLSEILHKLNAVNEYRTTPYLEDVAGTGETRILQI